MRYAMAYDAKKPAILFSVDLEWLLEVLGSEFGISVVGNYERADPDLLFELDSQTGLGFGGVMKPVAEKNPLCPDSFTQYRLDLPVLREEDPDQLCIAYDQEDHTDCRFCKGTGHSFEEIPESGDNIGRTLSVITCAIHMATATNPLCGPEEGILLGDISVPEQAAEVALGYRVDQGMEHAIRLWLSPDTFAAFSVAGALVRFAPILVAEAAIVSALDHMRSGTRCGIRTDVKVEPDHLYFDIEGECGLIQAHSPRFALPGQPMEYYAHDLRNTDNTLAMMAGIAALFPILTLAEQAVRCLKRRF